MFRNNTLSYLSLLLILCINNTSCMNISSGGGKCVVNGRVFYGNSIRITGNGIYVDGVLQDDGLGNFSSSSNWECSLEEKKTLSVNDSSHIVMENTIGNIEVTGHNNENTDLIITKVGKTEEDLKQILAIINQTHNLLEVKTKQANSTVQALIHYRLLLPQVMKFYCTLTNSSGDTSIQEIQGKVAIDSVSGKVTAQNIKGATQIKTSSGDISITSIQGPLTTNTTSGRVKTKDITGPVQIKSSSGDIDLNTVSDTTNIQTTSGRLEIRNIAALLAAYSSSGDMNISDIAYDFNCKSTSGRIVAKKILGNSNITTSSGDITCDVAGSFQGHSTSGKIKLRKKTINAPITISTSSGDIEMRSDTFNAMLQLSTSSGSFSSDFAMPIKKQRYGQAMNTQVGTGGPLVSLRTTSGDIELIQN